MANPKTLTTEECDKLLYELLWQSHGLNVKPKGHRNHTIALLMLDAGLRVGEVVQLSSYELYFNCEPVTSIIIPAEIAKNKTERIIPVSQRLSNALKNLYESYDSSFRKLYVGHLLMQKDIRFNLSTRQVERIIRAAAMKSLGRPVHPHVLRHTFASRLMRTTNMRTVQELLGHKSLSSTQIYTHPNQEDLKKAIDTMDDSRANLERHGVTYKDLDRTPNRLDTPGTDRDMG